MADDKEIVIKISAQNLTSEEFEKARKGIAGIRTAADDAVPKTNSFRDSIAGAADKSELANFSFGKMAGGMVASLLTVDALKSGFMALARFMGDSIKEAAEAEATQQRLTTALRAQGVHVPTVAQDYSRLSKEFGNLTTFSGTALTEMQAVLVTLGVSPRVMRAAMQATVDLATAKKIGLEAAATAVGKAIIGETGSLQKLVPSLDDVKVKGGDVAEVFRAVSSAAGGQAAAALDTYAGRVQHTANAWADFKQSVGDAVLMDPLVRASLANATDALRGVNSEAARGGKDITAWWMDLLGVRLTPQYQLMLAGLKTYLQLTQDIAAQMRAMRASLKEPIISAPPIGPVRDAKDVLAAWNEEATRQVEVQKKAKAESEAWSKSVRDLAHDLSGAKLQGEVKRLSEAVRVLGGEQKMTAVETARVATAAEQLRQRGATLTPELARLASTSELAAAAQRTAAKNLEGHTAALTKLVRNSIDATVAQSRLHGELHTGAEAWLTYRKAMTIEPLSKLPGDLIAIPIPPPPPATWWQKVFGQSDKEFGAALSSTIMGALQGGGNPADAAGALVGQQLMGSLAKKLTTSATEGVAPAVTGMFAGALNAALPVVGSLIGAFGGKVLSWFAGIFDQNKGRDLVKDFAATFGGFDPLHAKLLTLGDAGERLWIRLTQGVGRNNPEQAKAAIEAINQAFGAQEGQAEKLQRAIDKYGIAWEELGPKARNAKLNELAQALVEDFTLLTDAEIDAGIVSERMAEQVNDFLHRALRTGQEIPASMRPMLERMLEFGQLTDENGQKLEDLEGLTFAQTLTQGFQDITGELRNIADILQGRVAGSVRSLFDSIPRSVVIDFRAQRTGNWNFAAAEDGNDTNMEGYATGGIAVGRQVARLAERGRKEIVGDVEFMSNALAGALGRVRGTPGAAMVQAGGDTNLYVAIDPSTGTARMMGEGERSQIQRWLFSGAIQVPQRAITARSQ